MGVEISYIQQKYPNLRRYFIKLPGLIVIILLLTLFFFVEESIRTQNSFFINGAIILFLLFYSRWIIRGFEYTILLVSGMFTYFKYQKLNWSSILSLKNSSNKLESIFIGKLKNSEIDYKNIYHWIIIPTYKDPYKLIDSAIIAINNAYIDKKNIIITIAGEEADRDNFLRLSDKLNKKYKNNFFLFNTTLHKLKKGEVQGKGSNITYAAKATYKKLLHMGLKPDQVIVSVFDSESVISKNYFQILTYEYATLDDDMKDKVIFQPMLFLFNKFWEAPFFSKTVALTTTFYILGHSIKSIGARAQAVQAQTLKSLLATNFWSTETIVEDGHQYYRTFFTFNGKFKVVPIYSHVLLEPVIGKNLFESMKLQYNQIRRWSHGATDIAYTILCFIDKYKQLPKIRTLYEIFWLLESAVLWSSLQLILLMGGAFFFFNKYFFYISVMFSCLGIIILTIICLSILFFFPWKKENLGFQIYQFIKFVFFSFTLIGFILIFFHSLPAFHTQIMLVLGKPMGKFKATIKYR